MNHFTALIAAGTIATAAATISLPARADEYYVVHPDGQITREYTYPRHYGGYGYWSFSFGSPGIWFRDSYRHHYRDGWGHEWHERWQRNHRDHRQWEHHRRFPGHDDDD